MPDNNPSGIAEAMKWAFENGKIVQRNEDIGDVLDIDGHTYLRQYGKFTPFHPPEPHPPEKLYLTSLNGLVDFVKNDDDSLFKHYFNKYYVTINSRTVRLLSQPRGHQNHRDVIVECEFTPDRIPFGQYLDAEEMIILLQTRFADTPERSLVLHMVGNLNHEQAVQTADDGVSQKVVVKSGVQTNATTVFHNPVPLKPYRTFLEVEQVESPFVLRIKDRGRVALFDADSSMWAVKARENIRAYLDERIGDKVHTIV